MNFAKVSFFFILYLIMSPNIIRCQNIALNKHYTLSSLPNYEYSALPSDSTSLTDGYYAKTNYWTNSKTVGWRGKSSVSITIDLGQREPVGGITFNTVRNNGVGINFPKNIFVFLSNDDENFVYVGDLAQNSDNTPGPYLIKKFKLTNLALIARYIRFSVIPDGKFLFCDEIEVLKGNSTNLNTLYSIPRDSLFKIEDSVKSLQFYSKNLKKSFNTLKSVAKNNSSSVDSSIFQIQEQLKKPNLSLKDLKNLKREIGIQNSINATKYSSSPFLIEQYNPWDTLDQFYIPKANSSQLQYNYNLPIGYVEYGSFIILNNSSSNETFNFLIDKKDSLSDIELYKVAYVPSDNGVENPDPLVKVKTTTQVASGYTQMFIFKISGKNSGSSNNNLLVQSNGESYTLNIKANFFNLPALSINQTLNANVWAYFTPPILQNRKEQVMNDLTEHHINTMVIPPSVIPILGSNDFTLFNRYISNIKGIKNILLFLNYKSVRIRKGYGNNQFLSQDWKNQFKNWYQSIISNLKENGFSTSEIYLYPYDEVKGPDLNDFKNLILWTRKEMPEIKFYATLDAQNSVVNLLPLLDIAQIQTNFKDLNNLPSHKCQIWIYGVWPSAFSFSPYNYRLMSWQAFVNDYKGIGFWDYADDNLSYNGNLLSDIQIFPPSNYSVIYGGVGKEIISSRRWEAFKLGLEDYKLLKMYANKVGLEKAKTLASSVLSNYDIPNKANAVREIILNALIQQY